MLNAVRGGIVDAHHDAERNRVFELKIEIEGGVDEHDLGGRTAVLGRAQNRSLKGEG